MKYYFLFASLLLIAACKKSADSLPADPGCIDRIYIPVNAHALSTTELSAVNGLFTSNNIDHRDYRFYQYVHDTFQTLFPPFTAYDQKLIKVDQYTNGLHIFNRQINYIFFDDQLHYIAGSRTNGTNLDTLPHLTLPQLRGLFLREIREHSNESMFTDSCVKAEFGYYNLNTGGADTTEHLTKAWHLTPRNASYPEAYFKDGDGGLVYYFNGLYTLR